MSKYCSNWCGRQTLNDMSMCKICIDVDKYLEFGYTETVRHIESKSKESLERDIDSINSRLYEIAGTFIKLKDTIPKIEQELKTNE